MNSVTLTGRVGKDPEIKSFNNGDRSTATLTLATKRRTGRRAGEEVSTDWHKIVVTDTVLVKNYIEPHVRKGAMISITGELTYETFPGRDGKDVKITQIIVSDPRGVQIQLMDRLRMPEATNEAVEEQPTAENEHAATTSQTPDF